MNNLFKYKYLILWGIASFILFFSSCTPKALKGIQNSAEFEEDLEPYRKVYNYERERFEGEGILYPIAFTESPFSWKYSITDDLNEFLDYKPEYIYTPTVEVREFDGYRIQIYRGRNREEADRARRRSYEIFPRVTPYVEYSAPNYRVKVGDFIEKSEYVNIYRRLKQEFPTAMIVPARIKITIMNRREEN